MPRSKREVSVFSLSFLDIMSCAFGAVILLFLIIDHAPDTGPRIIADNQRASEVQMLEQELAEGQKGLAQVRNTISEVDDQLAVAQGLAARITEEKNETAALIEEFISEANSADLETIKSRIRTLESQNAELREQIAREGQDAQKMEGEGRQEYITGLKISGSRILILVDSSASMLDDSVVNVIRFRNMRDGLKRNADKWQRTLHIVDWLIARLPVDGHYQVLKFNTTTSAVLPETEGQWLAVSDGPALKRISDGLRTVVPEDGTNLERAFAAAASLRPLPDSILLVTDGLPTQGGTTSRGGTVTSRERLNLFDRALTALPSRVPVNIILLPLEGDPDAAPAFWGLARASNGSFMSPSVDWP